MVKGVPPPTVFGLLKIKLQKKYKRFIDWGCVTGKYFDIGFPIFSESYSTVFIERYLY